MAADVLPDFRPGATVQVTFSPDGMEAWVTLAKPMDALMLRGILVDHHGMRHGLQEEALERLATKPSGTPVLVAQGTPPVPGLDARIEYYFATEESHAPAIHADGRVDYRQLRQTTAVVENQELARKIEATPGVPGIKVTGQPVPAMPGKDLNLVAGKNTALAPDRLCILARRSGLPVLDKKGNVEVQPFLVLNEVDAISGNIEFQGIIQVKGNVQPGFTVKASDGIEIGGAVEGATLECGGPVKIGGTVRAQSVVTAGGFLQARYADSGATLHAQGDITIQDSVLHCNLTSGKRIRVGKSLIGGQCLAADAIEAQEVGNLAEVVTRLEVHQEPLGTRMSRLQAELDALEAQSASIADGLVAAQGHPNGAVVVARLTAQKVRLKVQGDRLRSELSACKLMDEPVAPRVVIRGTVHPGTHIVINGQQQRVTTTMFNKTFRLQEGRLGCG